MATKIHLIDLYAFQNTFDGNMLETLLFDSNISCKVSARFAKHPESDDFLEKSIAVEEKLVEDARSIIRDAIKTGIISADGRFKA